MQYKKNTLCGVSTSLGLYVTLALTSNTRIQVIANGPRYRREVTVYLPDNCPDKWTELFCKAVSVVERGECWPIRLDWENTRQFFTLEDIQQAERSLRDIPFCLYNAPALTTTSSLDLDALYKAKRRNSYKNLRI